MTTSTTETTGRALADTEFVFVYGTLKTDHGANYKLDRETKLGDYVSTSRFRVFGQGFPMAILDPKGHPLRGEVYTLSRLTLPVLDAYEGYPNFYDRSKLVFRSEKDDSCVAAWMYHITDYKGATFHHPLLPDKDGILEWLPS